jgi:DNA-binding HxlR family transcriptional regulator
MYQRKIPRTLNCGLDLLAEVLYGKWKIRLLYFISRGSKRPSELQRNIPDASRRVLNMQLNQLESHELITKKIFPEMPPKVEYNLTGFGKSLIPMIVTLGNWADRNQDHLRKVIRKEMKQSTLS